VGDPEDPTVPVVLAGQRRAALEIQSKQWTRGVTSTVGRLFDVGVAEIRVERGAGNAVCPGYLEARSQSFAVGLSVRAECQDKISPPRVQEKSTENRQGG
jgi:hypothetical protein